jgi:hypothetical protein
MRYSLVRPLVLAAVLAGAVGVALADDVPASPSPETIKKARDAGLKPEVRKGVTVFCWEDADIGSRFKTKKCVDEARLAEVLEQRQAQRDQMGRGGGNYGATK